MKNWKTTLIGLAGAVYLTLEPLLTTGEVNWRMITLGVIVGILGYLAKDKNVTGGTIQQ